MATRRDDLAERFRRRARERELEETTPQETVAPLTLPPLVPQALQSTPLSEPFARSLPPPPGPVTLPRQDQRQPLSLEAPPSELRERLGEIREDREHAERSAETGRVGTFVGAFQNAFNDIFAGAFEGSGAALEQVTTQAAVQFFGDEGSRFTSRQAQEELRDGNPFRSIAELIRDNPRLPVNPEFAEFFDEEEESLNLINILTTGTAQGLGSAGGFLAGIFLTGGFRASVGILGGLVNVSEIDRLAIENDVSAEKRIVADLAAFGVGLTEALPLARMLNRMGGGRILKATIQGIFEEGVQEFVQGASNNWIAASILGLEQDIIDEGVQAGTIIGGVTGALVSSGLAALGSRRVQRMLGAKDPPAGAAERAQAAADGQPIPSDEPNAVPDETEPVPAEVIIGAGEQLPEEPAAEIPTFPEELRPNIGELGRFMRAGVPVEGRVMSIENEVALMDIGEAQPVGIFIDRVERIRTEGEGPPPEPEAPPIAPPPPPPPPTPVDQGDEFAGGTGEPEAMIDTGRTAVVTTPRGTQLETQMVIVDADDVVTSFDEGFPEEFQPRDRTRQASEAQILEIAQNPDPGRLFDSAEADRGSPIGIRTENNQILILSGNARTEAVRRAQNDPELRQRFVDFFAEQEIETETTNKPLAVRLLQGEFTNEQLRQITIEANEPAGAILSDTEQAQADADLIDDSLLDSLDEQAGIGTGVNDAFVRGFLDRLPASQKNALLEADGQTLSQQGIRRVQGALLGKAYGTSESLSRILESTDDNVKSVSNAMLDAAPSVARLTQEIAAGRVAEEFAIGEALTEAVELVSKAREDRQGIGDVLAQQDLLAPRSGVVDELIRSFYNPDLTRAAGRDVIATIIRGYARETLRVAGSQQVDLLPGEAAEVTPEEVLRASREEVQGLEGKPPEQGGLLGPTPSPGPGAGPGGVGPGPAETPGAGPTTPEGEPAQPETEVGDFVGRARALFDERGVAGRRDADEIEIALRENVGDEAADEFQTEFTRLEQEAIEARGETDVEPEPEQPTTPEPPGVAETEREPGVEDTEATTGTDTGEGPRPPGEPEPGEPTAAEPETGEPAEAVVSPEQLERLTQVNEGATDPLANTTLQTLVTELQEGTPRTRDEIVFSLQVASNALFRQQPALSEVLEEIIEQVQLPGATTEETGVEPEPPAELDVEVQLSVELLMNEAATWIAGDSTRRKQVLDTTNLAPEDVQAILAAFVRDELTTAQGVSDETRVQALQVLTDRPALFDATFAAWVQSEALTERNRVAEGKKNQKDADKLDGKKFENTGQGLRRWWDRARERITRANQDDATAWIYDMETATSRGSLFRVDELLGKNPTPGVRRYMVALRSRIKPFKAAVWGNPSQYLRTWAQAMRQAVEANDKGELDSMQAQATQYIDILTGLAEAFEGVRTIDEATAVLDGLVDDTAEDSLWSRLRAMDARAGSTAGFRTDSVTVNKMKLTESKTDDELGRKGVIRRVGAQMEDAEIIRAGLGDDPRGGEVKSTADIKDEFGFADITIGKKAREKKNRPRVNFHVQNAFDAFWDLAAVMGIDRKSIGLLHPNGRLQFAIGALGQGGRHSAHYQDRHPLKDADDKPTGETVPVINLTFRAGDGSVAHEWAHNLDYALRAASKNGAEAMDLIVSLLKYDLTSEKALDKALNGVKRMLSGKAWWEGSKRRLRTLEGRIKNAEVYLDRIIRSMQRTSVNAEWQVAPTGFWSEANRSNNKKYWGNDREVFARAFESWAYDELAERGGQSYYLVNDWVEDGHIVRPAYKFVPYPQGEERVLFNNIMRILRDGLTVSAAGEPKISDDALQQLRDLKGTVLDQLVEIRADMGGFNDEVEAARVDKRRAEDEERRQKEKDQAGDIEQQIKDLNTPDPTEVPDFDQLVKDADQAIAEGQQDQNFNEGQDNDKTDADVTADEHSAPKPDQEAADFVKTLLVRMLTGQMPTKKELFELANEAFGGTRSEGAYTTKDAYDAMEIALHLNILNMHQTGVLQDVIPSQSLKVLRELTESLPPQTERSDEQLKFQAFSTPPPMAYVAGWLANMNENDLLLEPSAGTGALAVQGQAKEARIIVNDNNMRRRSLLSLLGITEQFAHDARFINQMLPKKSQRPTVVLMNPPFSSDAATGTKKNRVGAEHVKAALKALQPGGRLVAILGKGMQRNKPMARKIFWDAIDKKYRVRAAVRVSGKEYQKFGTTFDNMIIVIDKPTDGRVTVKKDVVIGSVETVDEIIPLLQDIRDDRPEPSGNRKGLASTTTRSEPGATGEGGTSGPEIDGVDPGLGGPRAGGEPTAPDQPDVGGTQGEAGAGPEVPGVGGQGTTGTRGGTGGTEGSATGGPAVTPKLPPSDDRTGGGVSPGVENAGVKDAVESASEQGIEISAEDAAKLQELFGGKHIGVSRVSIFPAGVDPNMYAAVKPILDRQWASVQLTHGSFSKVIAWMLEKHDRSILPYLSHYYETVVKPELAAQATSAGDKPGVPAGGAQTGGEPLDGEPAPRDEITESKDLDDATFVRYVPDARIVPEIAQPHPAILVETGYMAAITPPLHDFKPTIPDEWLTSGELSAEQWEAVAMAGNVHNKTLPEDPVSEITYRRGVIIGDGTGTGKTRIMLGIIKDLQERGIGGGRHVIVSPKKDLIDQLRADAETLGMDPKKIVLPTDVQTSKAAPIKLKEGIIFVSYGQLAKHVKERSDPDFLPIGQEVQVDDPSGKLFKHHRKTGHVVSRPSEKTAKVKMADGTEIEGGRGLFHKIGESLVEPTRLDQIIDWLGDNWEGALMFDEAHAMAHTLAEQGVRGTTPPSQRAQAGLYMERALSNARVTYLTATAAQRVRNLAYMNRVGLWGPGTQFAEVEDFINAVQSENSAMESIAQNMKANGWYLARQIGFDGVTFGRPRTAAEHGEEGGLMKVKLTDDQKSLYAEISRAWMTILSNVETALQLTDSGSNREVQNRISQIWGFQQRFFETLVTSLQMPEVIESMKLDILDGNAPVVQLVKTGDNYLTRALQRVDDSETADTFEDVEISPKPDLIALIEEIFPVTQFVDEPRPGGGTTSRPVMGPDGKDLTNQEALALRNELIRNLQLMRFPATALEQLYTAFGHDKIAEVTGRKVAVYEVNGVRIEKKLDNTKVATNKFMDGVKSILAFSLAKAGIGFDFHSSILRKNQKRRIGYVIAAGWSAIDVLQGMGRLNRTNQAFPPHYVLVTTELPAQVRFMASVARRLEQVGAISQGDSSASKQGLFGDELNIDNEYGQAAVRQLFSDIHKRTVPEIDRGDILAELGLRVINKDGELLHQKIPDVSRLFNRLLMLTPERQHIWFNEFSGRLQDNIDAAKQRGTYDQGTENFRADKIEKVHDEVVHVDADTTAETRYVKLQATRKVSYMTLERIVNEVRIPGTRELLFFARNIQSGKIYAIFEGRAGQQGEQRFRRYGIKSVGGELVLQDKIRIEGAPGRKANYEVVDSIGEAKTLWDAEIKAAPVNEIEDVHLIVGPVLQIWHSIIGAISLVRTIVSGGELLLGRRIADDSVTETLELLGASGAKINLSSGQIMDRILKDGAQFILANQTKLRRRTVGGEARIEVTGFPFSELSNLRAFGVFDEQTSEGTSRMFIPSSKARGVPVLDKMTEFNPVRKEINIRKDKISQQTAPYELREGATMEAIEMGEQLQLTLATLAEAAEQRGVKTLATSINAEFVKNESATLRGQTVETAEDLATLAQIFREPRIEILRYFFVDKAGKILTQLGVTARMPGSTATFPTGEDHTWVQETADRVGATGIWMVHNHPNGDSTPSNGDMAVTNELAEALPDLTVRHVVINSNEYSTFDSQLDTAGNAEIKGFKQNVELDFGADELLTAALPHPSLGKTIKSVTDLAKINAAVQTGAGWITVVGTVPARGKPGDRTGPLTNRVRALGVIHESMLIDSAEPGLSDLDAALRDFSQEHGAVDVFLVGVRPSQLFGGAKTALQQGRRGAKWAQRLIQNGFVKDVLTNDGESLSLTDPAATKFMDVTFGLRTEESGRSIGVERTGKIENDTTKHQSRIVNMVKQGQPIDRIMRALVLIPFNLAHRVGIMGPALNARGESRLGAVASDRLAHYLTRARFKDDGAFGWANGIIEHARHGLIDRHRVDKKFIQTEADATAFGRSRLLHGFELLNRLFEAGVTSLTEARVIQDMMNGIQVPENKWRELTDEIRAAIDELGMEAVRFGLISRESYERNRGSYLHRVYVKYEQLDDSKTLSRFIGRAIAGKRHKIIGDAMRGRGIDEKITQERLMRDIPAAREFFGLKKITGKPDPSLLGRKFVILDQVKVIGGKTGTLEGIEEGSHPTKLIRRIYWPADEAIPTRFGDVEVRGTFEVRDIIGDKLFLWRDLSKAERVQLGEIMDARYTIAKTFHSVTKDLASAKFQEDISKNPEWTWDAEGEPPSATIGKPIAVLRNYVGYEWVKVPKIEIPKSGGRTRWGALTGRYVRAEIWKDLNELDQMAQSGPWQTLLSQWKLNKTARNPVVHLNNVMSNLVLMDLIDIRARDLLRGFQAFVEHGDDFRLADQHGLFAGSFITAEIKKNIMEPALREMQAQAQSGTYEKGYTGKIMFANDLAAMFSKIKNMIQRGDQFTQDLYRWEDEVFRMAAFLKKLQEGYTPAEAAMIGREQFLNYDIRAPWVNKARRSFLPFIAYSYRAIPAIADAIMRRPWKLAKYAILAEMANALSYAVTDDDEELERASLRPEVRGDVWIAGVPRLIKQPFRDRNDNPVFLDIRRWIPAGDVFDLQQNQALPIPAWLQFGGPLIIAAELVLNRAAFTGEDIVNPLTDTLGDKTKKYGEFLYRSLAPSAPWIYNSWYWERIAGAVAGRRDVLGRPTSITQAVAQSIGFKFSSQDVQLNFQYRAGEFDRTARALDATLRQAERDFLRKIISKSAFAEIQTDTLEKQKRLEDNRRETFAPLVKGRAK